MALGIIGVAIGVVVPRILGHATDLLFNGMIGRRLPAGISKADAVADARARGDETFAALLSGMNVVPGRGVDFSALARTLTVALILYTVSALLLWTQARLLNAAVQQTMVALRSQVEDKLHRVPLSFFDTRQRGELLSRVTNDIDNLQSSLALTISRLVSAILSLVAVTAMMAVISPLLTLITLAAVPLSLLATRAVTRRSQPMFAAQWRSTGALTAHLEETYSGFTVVATFGHRRAARDQFHRLNAEVYRASFGAQFVSSLVQPATMFIGNLGYVAVAVLGGVQIAAGQITLGSVQAFIQYVRQFNSPVAQVAQMYNTLQSGVASAERVFDLLDEPEQIPDPAHPACVPVEAPRAPRVEFADVTFGYHPQRPVIQNLSLVAEPGTTVAIVGPTGAGKTTLVNLLLRFYEIDCGTIFLDGIDIASMARTALRYRIGMVLQDTWLFDATIADNIAYGRPGASPQDIADAAASAHLDRFIAGLPEGLNTPINGGGVTISAGERQLITIARAFLAQPQLLILDEATSSVDTRTELLIQQAMCELRRDRTSFIVAHRLSTIRDADRIVVLEAGRILETGTHTELLARHGAYYAMTQA